MLDDAMIADIVAQVKPYSMAPDIAIAFTIKTCLQTIEAGVDGAIVECGTWRGGASFAMLLAQRQLYGRVRKPVFMLDSFEGLPPVDERDGPAAAKWQSATDSPSYRNNCAADVEDVKRTKEAFGFSDEDCPIVPGWFNQTIPALAPQMRKTRISLLRVDCDWYAPVRFVLENLSDVVTDEGYIILDDYYFWDGCALATHDFLAGRKLSWRIKSAPQLHGAFMQKRQHRVGRV